MIDNDELNECEKSWFEKMLSVYFKYKEKVIEQINKSNILKEYTNYYIELKFSTKLENTNPMFTGVLVEMRVYLENKTPIQFLLHVVKGVVSYKVNIMEWNYINRNDDV